MASIQRSFSFQFTPLREGRRVSLDYLVGRSDISIHAPPRGATLTTRKTTSRWLFQFTPLREGRRRLCTVRGHLLYFNSRPSARGDKSGTNQYTTQRHFNSRPSARGDVRTWSNWDGTSISIHAPPRGATCRFQNSREAHIFQFTPLREGRQSVYYKVLEDYIFQFTPLREGRPKN